MNVVAAFNQDARRELRLVATIGSYIANFSGFGREQVIEPSDLMPEAFRGGDYPSEAWLEAQYERHNDRLERERSRQ